MDDLSPVRFFLEAAPEMQQLCQPLLHLGLTSFVYQKNDLNGYEVRLSNQPQWLTHFYRHDLYHTSQFDTTPKNFRNGIILWSELKAHQQVLDDAYQHNIAHGLTLTKTTDHYAEHYFFGTTVDNPQAQANYLNNIDLLERFILYFKDRGRSLLEAAEQHKAKLDKTYHRNIETAETGAIFKHYTFDRDAFLNATHVHYLELTPEISLTKRELDCAMALIQGKTMLETATDLFLSPRTVETHINHLKEKLNCKSKSNLITTLRHYGLHQWMGD